MAIVTWRKKLYDLGGNLISSVDEATNRSWAEALNGIDQMDIGLYHDDALVPELRPGYVVLKMWRDVVDPENGISSIRPDAFPTFAGILGQRNIQPGSNVFNYTFYSPLWRLQSRFHLLDHYLGPDTIVLDPQNTGPGTEIVPATVGNLLWKLIDLVNNTWGPDVNETGIGRGSFEDTGLLGDVYTIAKNDSTWEHFDSILSAFGSPDIAPTYQHVDGNNEYMLLNTRLYRGLNLTGAWGLAFPKVALYYTQDRELRNLADLGLQEVIQPGVTANFVRGHGQAGKESISAQDDETGVYFGRDEVGPYMKNVTYDSVHTAASLWAHVQMELKRTGKPVVVWSPQLGQNVPPYYGVDFGMGDLIVLNADRDGRDTGGDLAQRVYQMRATMSDNNVETVTVAVADDFTDKVPPTQ